MTEPNSVASGYDHKQPAGVRIKFSCGVPINLTVGCASLREAAGNKCTLAYVGDPHFPLGHGTRGTGVRHRPFAAHENFRFGSCGSVSCHRRGMHGRPCSARVVSPGVLPWHGLRPRAQRANAAGGERGNLAGDDCNDEVRQRCRPVGVSTSRVQRQPDARLHEAGCDGQDASVVSVYSSPVVKRRGVAARVALHRAPTGRDACRRRTKELPSGASRRSAAFSGPRWDPRSQRRYAACARCPGRARSRPCPRTTTPCADWPAVR